MTHIVPGIFEKIETRKDRTLKCTFITQELAPEESVSLMSLVHEYGYVGFSKEEIKREEMLDIPEIKNEFPTDKTPSQRLRNALYVLWEQEGKKGDSDLFYKQRMEQLINQIKERLT